MAVLKQSFHKLVKRVCVAKKTVDKWVMCFVSRGTQEKCHFLFKSLILWTFTFTKTRNDEAVIGMFLLPNNVMRILLVLNTFFFFFRLFLTPFKVIVQSCDYCRRGCITMRESPTAKRTNILSAWCRDWLYLRYPNHKLWKINYCTSSLWICYWHNRRTYPCSRTWWQFRHIESYSANVLITSVHTCYTRE